MSIYTLTGPGFNFLNRVPSSQVTPSPASDATLAIQAAWDYKSELCGKFSTASAWSTIADLNLCLNSGFEAWAGGHPSFWVSINGGGAQDTSIFDSGLSSVSMGSAQGESQNVIMRAGELFGLLYALRGDGAAGIASIYVQNLDTGNWYNGTTWVANKTALSSRPLASWGGPGAAGGSVATQIAVEPYLSTLTFLTTLQITVQNSGASGTAWADSIALFPATSWLSIHGHNVAPATPVTLKTSPTGAFGGEETLQGTLGLLQPACYLALVPEVYFRYVKIATTGTPQAATWFGEVVLGQYIALQSGAVMDGSKQPENDVAQPQVRNMTIGKSIYAQNLSPWPLRSLKVPFVPINKAQYQDLRDNIALRSQMGGFPMVFAPADYDAELVVFGYLQNAEQWLQDFLLIWEMPIQIDETPTPWVTG